MKRTIAVLLSLCLLALLCACGEKEEPAAPAPAAAEAQTQEEVKPQEPEAASEETKAEAPAPVEEAAPEAPAEEPAAPTLLETALTFVDKDAAELVAAIGEPLDKVYEESCSGPGDDGVWTYDGLTVFTYTENGVETIVDAE